ncbi:MAG: winged helix-turn-helix domain-containing protein [Thiolinea sp.]
MLAEHQGRVVSKDELFAEIWKEVTVTDDSLVQCIAEIRRVLHDSEHKILQTVPRKGYVLTVDEAPMSAVIAPDCQTGCVTGCTIPLHGPGPVCSVR